MPVDGWFRETNKLWPGQAWTLKVDQILHHEKSQYHDILVFDSPQYGSVLVVDNAVQCTERDEFGYNQSYVVTRTFNVNETIAIES